MSLRKLYTLLFFLGLFFIPFNEFEGLSFLGEYKDESATYFFLVGFIFLIVESLIRGKISIPYKNSISFVLILFIVWTFLSTVINYETVSENYFKATSGINRYFRQTFSLLISAVVFTTFFWNIIKNYSAFRIFILIRKVFLFSFIFVSVYGFIEIAIVFFGMGFLTPILESFDYFPFVNTHLHNTESRMGISSVTFEIPALGTYLITLLPWMASYIFTEKNIYKFIPLGMIMVLLFFSDSRSALVVILIQLFVFLLILIHDLKYRKNTLRFLKYGTVLISILLLIKSEEIVTTVSEKADRLNFSKNLTQSISNKSRFGMQYASLVVFSENPITGVGLGQVAYHSRLHYPYWATHNNYEYELFYKNQTEKSFPPNFNFYTRILAELGLVGFLLLIALFFLCLYYSVLYWKLVERNQKFLGIILILSFTGIIFNWIQLDYFRQYGFWLCLMLLIKCRMDFNSKQVP